jgi:hypothetical protein
MQTVIMKTTQRNYKATKVQNQNTKKTQQKRKMLKTQNTKKTQQ